MTQFRRSATASWWKPDRVESRWLAVIAALLSFLSAIAQFADNGVASGIILLGVCVGIGLVIAAIAIILNRGRHIAVWLASVTVSAVIGSGTGFLISDLTGGQGEVVSPPPSLSPTPSLPPTPSPTPPPPVPGVVERVRCSVPATARPGATITMTYTIVASGPLTVGLGAGVYTSTGDDLSNGDGDADSLPLNQGENSNTRLVAMPTGPGRYEVTAEVWPENAIGRESTETLKDSPCGFVTVG